MTPLPPDDELQAFLRQYRPTPPPALPELEEQLMIAIASGPHPQQPVRVGRRWAIPSAIAAGLLVLSTSRLLMPSLELSNASTEAFLESNWNDLIGPPANTPNNSPQTDWMFEASTAQ